MLLDMYGHQHLANEVYDFFNEGNVTDDEYYYYTGVLYETGYNPRNYEFDTLEEAIDEACKYGEVDRYYLNLIHLNYDDMQINLRFPTIGSSQYENPSISFNVQAIPR